MMLVIISQEGRQEMGLTVVEQLEDLMLERESLRDLDRSNEKYRRDVLALRYAISVLEAVT